ncbi:MAG: sugar-binding protein [Sandaracinaceae bacterium]
MPARSSYAALGCLGALLLASPAHADLGDSALGLNTHVPSDDLLDMAADSGVNWIRVDANWRDIHTAPAAFDFAEMDRVVDGAGTRGLHVYMTLAYTPDWVATVPRTRTDGYAGNDQPASSTEWVEFVEAMVTRYSARGVTHFGIWNEPNLDQFWESAAGVDAYIDTILVPGADAVHRTCSSCIVAGPDLAHVGDYDAFLDRVLERAIASFDVLAHHIYNGWPETGSAIFDGDRFLEALEMRRFPFTRSSLREVLDARGWTGEVWITETGYRADPPGDTMAEDRQATYVRRVMEEQLARPWWTNSFFYEITDCGVDQPGCPIDGFGITRPNRPLSPGGPRSFPADYRLKPAYMTIRDFVAMHPEIVMGAPPPQCANGMDDDGDGRIDSMDRGCVDGLDADESDDPVRRTLEVVSAPRGIRVDGNLGDFGPGPTIALGAGDWVGVTPYGSAGDLSATLTARYTVDALWIGVVVTDDAHVATDPDDQLYLGDSVQLAFDIGVNRNTGYDADDHELNFALRDGTTATGYRFFGNGTDDWDIVVRRTATTTTYEIGIPRTALSDVALTEGTEIGFSFLINEDDGATTDDGTGREGWLEWTPGIGVEKDPYQYGTLVLRRFAPPFDAGAGDAGEPTDAGMLGLDAGPNRFDAGSGSSGDGCGCRAAPRSDAPYTLILAVLGFVVLRRRR